MIVRRLTWIVGMACVLSIAVLGTAQAATPFTAGSGADPAVAVGFDGSGHVAWATEGANAQVGYCRVSAGTESCNRTDALNFGAATAAGSVGRPQVFVPAPGKVVIVSSCTQCPTGFAGNRTYRWTSTDNGSSFAAGVLIGEGFATGGIGTWLDSSNLFVAANSNSVSALQIPPVGSPVPIAPPGYFFGGEVARLPGANTLVAASNNLNAVGYRVYNGSLTAPAVNVPASWGAVSALAAPEGDNSDTTLNAGPNGVFLAYLAQSPGNAQLGLRHFDPGTGTFGAPLYVQGSDPIDTGGLGYPDSFQDLAGRLYFVWRSLHDGGRLRFRMSDPSGTSFSPVGTLAAGESFIEPEVAAGDEAGFAVWTQGSSGPIRVVPLDPRAEPSPPPTPSTPAAGGGSPVSVPPGAPVVTRPTIGDRTLLPGQGTTFRFSSSKAGLAVLTIEKRFKGLKGKRKGKPTCLPQTRKRLRALRRQADTPSAYRKLLKRRSCRAFGRVGEIRQQVRPGVNTIAFDGRVAGRKLGKGSYRASLVITDSAGQPSRTESLSFKVVGPKPKPPARR